MSEWGWVKDAVCAQFGPLDDVWFNEEDDDGVQRNDPGVARRVCEACPVRQACLKVAVEEDHYGMWGGTTRAERHRMRINAQRAATRQSRAA